MGGETFTSTTKLTKTQYDEWLEKFMLNDKLKINIDYMLPYRLGNKTSYSDIDIILFDENKIIEEISKTNKIKETKTIKLFDNRFECHSVHLLTEENIQIDLLKSWSSNIESMNFTRIYYSYSCANIFFKKLVSVANINYWLSHLGLMCYNNKQEITDDLNIIQIDSTTRLLINVDMLFEMIDLDKKRFTEGFVDEYELLDYFKTSKYYNKISFIQNSKFRHNCKRLPSFNNLFINGLLNVV